MTKIVVLGLHITPKVKDTLSIQDILTKFGCSIKTRLGLNDLQDDGSDNSRLIILELTGDEDEMIKLENELIKVDGLKVQKMSF